VSALDALPTASLSVLAPLLQALASKLTSKNTPVDSFGFERSILFLLTDDWAVRDNGPFFRHSAQRCAKKMVER